MRRFFAVLEVIVVTAVTWAAYKTMKIVEPFGFNCSPGFAMLVAACIMIVLRRRDFGSYGIVSVKWRHGVVLGVAFGLLMLLGGAVEVALLPIGDKTPANTPIQLALVVAAIRVPIYLAMFFLLIRLRWRQSLERVPLACTISILAVLLIAAPVFAAYRGAPLSHAVGLAGSLVFFTAIGEEVFFRGYVQSRLNGVFGRPWRFLGASLGPGLFISSLLFGLIHVFNPTTLYPGHWEVSWLWGVSGFLAGLLYGYLRELTGTIWTATVVHALGGEYRGLWQVYLSKP